MCTSLVGGITCHPGGFAGETSVINVLKEWERDSNDRLVCSHDALESLAAGHHAYPVPKIGTVGVQFWVTTVKRRGLSTHPQFVDELLGEFCFGCWAVINEQHISLFYLVGLQLSEGQWKVHPRLRGWIDMQTEMSPCWMKGWTQCGAWLAAWSI